MMNFWEVSIDTANFVGFSDGAVRGSGGASAAWAILAMQGSHLQVVSGGAKLLASGTTSLEAEARALHLSLEYFRRIAYPREAFVEVEELEATIPFTDLCRDILARSLNWESEPHKCETVF